MCKRVVKDWMKRECQARGRTAYWGYVEETERYLRVIMEEDGETVWTTHWDRNYKREVERERRKQDNER